MQKGRICAFYTLYSTLDKSQVFTILYARENAFTIRILKQTESRTTTKKTHTIF